MSSEAATGRLPEAQEQMVMHLTEACAQKMIGVGFDRLGVLSTIHTWALAEVFKVFGREVTLALVAFIAEQVMAQQENTIEDPKPTVNGSGRA